MNPFNVLGAVPTDSRQRLQALLQNAALLGNSGAAEEAYAALIKPEARLDAELRWFPEKESKQERPIWRLNRLLERADAKQNPARLMMKACECWGAQETEELLEVINADHALGGWKAVQPDELREAVRSYLSEIAAQLDGLYQYDGRKEESLRKVSVIMASEQRDKGQKKLVIRYANALLALIARYERGAQGFVGNELVETLVSRFELRFATQTEKLREKILQTTAQRKTNGAFSWKPGDLRHNLQDWSTLTMPMRKLTHARGLRSEPSEALADEIRLFMAALFDRFNDALNAKQLLYKLRDCFPEYEWLQAQLKKDEAVILNEEKRKKFEAKEKREKAWTPFGVLLMVLGIILNRCAPEEPVKRSSVPSLSEENLRLAKIYMTNVNLREKREAIEKKEKEIQMAFALGGKVDIQALNAELLKLRAEYAALKLNAEKLLEDAAND